MYYIIGLHFLRIIGLDRLFLENEFDESVNFCSSKSKVSPPVNIYAEQFFDIRSL